MARSRNTADTQTASGGPVSPFIAGKNAVINGGMDIWQRGTSITTGNYVYTADRWQTWNNTVYTVSRQATGDTTNLPNIQYALRFQRNSGSTSTTPTYLAQTLETANSIPYSGKAITFSFYARAGANYSGASSTIPFQVRQGTGTDQNVIAGMTGVSDVINSSATLTTTWQRFTYTATVSSSATQLGFFFAMTGVGTAGANDYFEVTGVQLELGSSATPFSRAGGTIQGELAACQRYYRRSNGSSYAPHGVGTTFSTNQADIIVQYPVQMRVTPSVAFGGSLQIQAGNSSKGVSSIGDAGSSPCAAFLRITNSSSGWTIGQGAFCTNNADANAYMEFSSEL